MDPSLAPDDYIITELPLTASDVRLLFSAVHDSMWMCRRIVHNNPQTDCETIFQQQRHDRLEQMADNLFHYL